MTLDQRAGERKTPRPSNLLLRARYGTYLLGRMCHAYFADPNPRSLFRYFSSNLIDKVARHETFAQLDRLEAERDKATVEKFVFIRDNMQSARLTASRWDVLEIALGQVTRDGLYAEFGVGDGESLRYICERAHQEVYGFDSFQGLPETWAPGVWQWTFARPGGAPPDLPKNATVVAGYFNESLPGFVQRIGERPMAFLHMDADLYSSTSAVLSALRSHILPQTVLVFDEYYGYPGWSADGEFRAFAEFIQATGYRFEYLACNVAGQQVAVRILPNTDATERAA